MKTHRTRRRIAFLLFVVFLALGVFLLFPSGRLILCGLLKGESFYHGKPTQYWRSVAKKQTTKFHNIFGSCLIFKGPTPIAKISFCDRISKKWRQTWTESTYPLLDGDPAAIPVLRELIQDPDPDVRQAAANGLERIGPKAESMVPLLCKMLKEDADESVRGVVVRALGVIGRPSVIPLVALLKEDNLSDPYSAWEAIGQIGPEASEAIPFLIKGLKDRKGYIAARALASIGPAIMPTLRESLNAKNSYVRANATCALGGREHDPNVVVPLLREALKDEDPGVRQSAAGALIWIGPAAEPAVPDLILALMDLEIDVRCAAARALGYIGPGAKLAIPALKQMVEKDGEFERVIASRSIQVIENKLPATEETELEDGLGELPRWGENGRIGP